MKVFTCVRRASYPWEIKVLLVKDINPDWKTIYDIDEEIVYPHPYYIKGGQIFNIEENVWKAMNIVMGKPKASWMTASGAVIYNHHTGVICSFIIFGQSCTAIGANFTISWKGIGNEGILI